MEPSRDHKERDHLYADLLILTRLSSERQILDLQNRLFVGYGLSFEDLKLYFLLLKAYIRRAQQGRPFNSLTEMAVEVTREASQYRTIHGVGLTTTHRTDLFRNIKRLTELTIEEGAPLIMRAEHAVEVRIHAQYWTKKAPYRRTWKKNSYFPVSLLRSDNRTLFTPEELEAFIEPLVRQKFQTGNELTDMKRLFGESGGRRFPSAAEARKEAQQLLDNLTEGSAVSLLYAFSIEDIEEHLRKRQEVDRHGENSR